VTSHGKECIIKKENLVEAEKHGGFWALKEKKNENN
jgi:hypothetical protein